MVRFLHFLASLERFELFLTVLSMSGRFDAHVGVHCDPQVSYTVRSLFMLMEMIVLRRVLNAPHIFLAYRYLSVRLAWVLALSSMLPTCAGSECVETLGLGPFPRAIGTHHALILEPVLYSSQVLFSLPTAVQQLSNSPSSRGRHRAPGAHTVVPLKEIPLYRTSSIFVGSWFLSTSLGKSRTPWSYLQRWS